MSAGRISAGQQHVEFIGRGVTSRQPVHVRVALAEPGHGIVFASPRDGQLVLIPAKAEFVLNTLRNVVLGSDGVRVCIVEHFLAAASLWGLHDLLVTVNGPELPLGDGSGAIWIELFKSAGWIKKEVIPSVELKQPLVVSRGDRMLIAIPEERFSASYHMDWDHPKIGKRWQAWDASKDPAEIYIARTFGALKEHKLLGLEHEVVSLTDDGFTQPLHFDDEPVRHKLLDLIGDLALCGVNPLSVKARFISIKAGHELDVEMARRLSSLFGSGE